MRLIPAPPAGLLPPPSLRRYSGHSSPVGREERLIKGSPALIRIPETNGQAQQKAPGGITMVTFACLEAVKLFCIFMASITQIS